MKNRNKLTLHKKTIRPLVRRSVTEDGLRAAAGGTGGPTGDACNQGSYVYSACWDCWDSGWWC